MKRKGSGAKTRRHAKKVLARHSAEFLKIKKRILANPTGPGTKDLSELLMKHHGSIKRTREKIDRSLSRWK